MGTEPRPLSRRDIGGWRGRELVRAHAEWVRKALRLGDNAKQVVIDEVEVTFIDSTGLNALLVE